MGSIKNAWTQQRLEYQIRYAKICEKCGSRLHQNSTEFYKGKTEGAMIEMSWVLINIFGLTSKEVQEVEQNKGLTNADYESQEVQPILCQVMKTKKHYGED